MIQMKQNVSVIFVKSSEEMIDINKIANITNKYTFTFLFSVSKIRL